MERPRTTPKDFFLWAGAMIALYLSVFSFLSLVFNYINYAFPDALAYLPADPYQSGINYEMASLIVLFPVFIVLMRVIHADIGRDPSRRDIWVRRWALVLTLFAAGVTIAVDLIVLLTAFLGGEDLTVRFLLKVLIVLLVAGAGFLHFISDLRGYWEKHFPRVKAVGWGAGTLVLATIIAGFFIVGTPHQARLYRFDAQKATDLQTIQYQVVNYWQQKQQLPSQLSDLTDPIAQFTAPVDPQTKQPYEYHVAGPLSFALCADFNEPSRTHSTITPEPAGLGSPGSQDIWAHGAGHVCFDRTIDPERYPPVRK